jgi:UMF1 family MFS transporter
MGKISGLGWGIGYIGGLLSLIIVLPFVHNHQTRLVFPLVALFFGIFAIFTFVLLKEVHKPSKRTNYFKTAYFRIMHTVKNIRDFKELLKFIFSYLIYNDGIIVVISFGAIYGATRFGMTQKELIIYFIIANVTSIIGSFGFGFITDKVGAKKTISVTLFIWMAVVLAAFFSETIAHYYYVGILAGIAIGASQSSSRTMLALLTPESKMGEFFGFYSITGKVASIFGPLIYGEVARITGDQKWAILSVLAFFIAGLFLLNTVDEAEGRKTAEAWIE